MGSRTFVHENIYEAFLSRFTELSDVQARATGDPFTPGTTTGPLISQTQFDVSCFPPVVNEYSPVLTRLQRVTGYIKSGIQDGATVHLGAGSSGVELEVCQTHDLHKRPSPNENRKRRNLWACLGYHQVQHQTRDVPFCSPTSSLSLCKNKLLNV